MAVAAVKSGGSFLPEGMGRHALGLPEQAEICGKCEDSDNEDVLWQQEEMQRLTTRCCDF